MIQIDEETWESDGNSYSIIFELQKWLGISWVFYVNDFNANNQT